MFSKYVSQTYGENEKATSRYATKNSEGERKKEIKIEKYKGSKRERETDGERRRGYKGQKVNRQNFSGIFTFTMNVIMCECACVE